MPHCNCNYLYYPEDGHMSDRNVTVVAAPDSSSSRLQFFFFNIYLNIIFVSTLSSCKCLLFQV